MQTKQPVPVERFLYVYGSKADPILFSYGPRPPFGHHLDPNWTIDQAKHIISHQNWLGSRILPIYFKLYLAEVKRGEQISLGGDSLEVDRTLTSYLNGNNLALVAKFLDQDDILFQSSK